MLVSHAHSFRQQARLAVTLAWVAGYTNIVTLLACGTVTSHVSGTTSLLGRDISIGAWGPAGLAIFLLACFFLGAGVSGFCIELGRRRGWESIFVMPIVIEAALLGTFAILLSLLGAPTWASPLEFLMTGMASLAMGLQNATITQISRGQVRTTHVTGVLSDLGQEVVQYCWWALDHRRLPPNAKPAAPSFREREHPVARRLLLLASVLFVFAVGSGLGAWFYTVQARYAMIPPVLFLLWIIYQDITTPIAEIEPANDMINGMNLPSTLAIFHLQKNGAQKGRAFRIPNLLAWSERLPPETRVVILDVAEIQEFNANALLELRLLRERFTSTGRTLIVSGMAATHAQGMKADPDDHSIAEFICPDLELAIARGLNSLETPAESAQTT